MSPKRAFLVILAILGLAAGGAFRTAIASPPQAARASLVGVVLPSDTRPGDTVSGRVVTNPKDYEDIPGLHVVEMQVPAEAGAHGEVQLEGMVIGVGDEGLQEADRLFTVHLRETETKLAISLLDQGSRASVANGDFPLIHMPSESAPLSERRPEAFHTPPVCQPGSVQVIHGPFGGDANATSVQVGVKSAPVLAESPRAAYFTAPSDLPPGPAQLTLKDGPVTAQFPLTAIKLTMTSPKTTLHRGERSSITVRVEGLQGLPSSSWQAGSPQNDLVDPKFLRTVAPDFHPPVQGEPGEVLLRVENASPQTVTLSPSPVILRTLHRHDFADGSYRLGCSVRSLQSGQFVINALVVPFFGDVPGQGPGGPVIADGPKREEKHKGEWRAVGVETTRYTEDSKDRAKFKEKMAEWAQKFLDKAAPEVGKIVEQLPAAFSITRAVNVYVTYACVDLTTGKVVKTKVVELDDNDGIYWWPSDKTSFKDKSGDRSKAIARNKPRDPCP